MTYAGSAGGQPRLLIPTINAIVDPATNNAMNAILRWANTLMLGGGGLSNWACYPVAGETSTVIDWAGPPVSNFEYVQSDNETILFPPGTITLVIVDLSVEYTTIDPETLSITCGLPTDGNAENLIVGSNLIAYIGLNGIMDTNDSPGFSTNISLSITGSGSILNAVAGQMSLFSYTETT